MKRKNDFLRFEAIRITKKKYIILLSSIIFKVNFKNNKIFHLKSLKVVPKFYTLDSHILPIYYTGTLPKKKGRM